MKDLLGKIFSKLGSMDTWRSIRDKTVEHFKKEWVKIALKKVLDSAVAGGIRGWIIKFIAEYMFEKIAQPVIEVALRKGFLIYDKSAGKIKIKKINQAKEDGNEDDYLDHISSV